MRRTVTSVALVLLVVATVIEVFAIRANLAAERVQDTRTRHLVPALAAANALMQAAIDQETGVRGYIITADPAFLEPYEQGRVAEAEAITALDAALRDRYPELRALVDPVAFGLVRWRDSVADNEAALVDEGRPEAAADLVATGRGRLIFDAVRRDLETLAAAIEEERAATRDDLLRRTDQQFLVAQAAAVAVLAVGVALFVVLRRRLAAPLDRLAHEATAVASGRLDTPITPDGPTEIRTVSEAVEQMRLQLLGEVRQAFTSGMVQAEEAERARLAGELHDDPIQVLVSAQWQLESLAMRLGDDDRAALGRITASIVEVQSRLRTLMFRLHPPALDDEGLQTALDDLIADTFDDGAGVGLGAGARPGAGSTVTAHLHVDLGDPTTPPLSSATTTLLFRIAAEAIRNVRKHAHAGEVTVSVRHTGDGVQLRVVDDGAGFDRDALPAGPHGNSISRALATAAGGWWHVAGRPGHGTIVSCWLPALPDRSPVEFDVDADADVQVDAASKPVSGRRTARRPR